MCGIAGIFGNFSGTAIETALRAMRDAQIHRGPDDSGLRLFHLGEGALGLAHTRLSILDLSAAGHQPMDDYATGNCITYNGEIYNYRQLRAEVGAGQDGIEEESRAGGDPTESGEARLGRRPSEATGLASATLDADWRSRSDTEVILRAYARWGGASVLRLRGMFAFALWDRHAERLFLARDPFGIKPLYYYQKDQSFLFASEIRALLASGWVPRKLSADGLASYLEFGSVQDPLTIIDGVQALMPGHCLKVGLKKGRLQVDKQRYTEDLLRSSAVARASNRNEALDMVRAKLLESVRLHLVSDVPVAAFLSGGIDSSAIVGLMSGVAKKPPRTFTVTFSEKIFSEQAYASSVARRFKTEHQDICLTEREMLRILPDALACMDQPTVDGINTFVIAKAVREAGVKVALSGLGGDELFGGYPSFRRAETLQRIARVPRGLRRAAAALGRSLLNGTARRRKFWDLVESDCSSHAAYAISRRLFAPEEVAALMVDFRSLAPRVGVFVPCADPVNDVALYELQGYMANTLLRDTDQMGMAHGLEVRVPFVDPEIVRFVFGLPGNWKWKPGRPKSLLLDALADMLPEEVWDRPKMGFTLPFERWLRSVLQGELDATLSNASELTRSGLDPRYAATIWQAFKRYPRHQSWARPWALHVLEQWYQLNEVHR